MEWTDLKNELIAKKRLDKLFASSADHNALVRMRGGDTSISTARGTEETNESVYEPLLLERLFKDISELLDRVLAYRREARELEVLAVKAATDYQLFKEQSVLDQGLEEIRLRQKQKEIARQANADAATLFGESDSLCRGFGRISLGKANEMMQEAKDAQSELELLREKWLALHKYHDGYMQRYKEPRNAHNFAERAERVFTLLGEDLQEAYAKAKAASVGVEMVYGRKAAPLPAITLMTFIDDFVSWCREEIRRYELEGESEIEYDLVVPLVQPCSPVNDSLVKKERFLAALAAAQGGRTFVLEFDLPATLFFGDRNVRLTGVGISYGNRTNILETSGTDRNATADSYARLRATLFSPEQRRPERTVTYRRPPIRFGNVGVFTGQPPSAFSSGSECRNINPVGTWRVVIDPLLVYKDSRPCQMTEGIEGNPMQDLKLHLRVRARPQDAS